MLCRYKSVADGHKNERFLDNQNDILTLDHKTHSANDMEGI